MADQPFWNPSDKHASITLSDSDRTATTSGANTNQAVRSTVGLSSGKWYVERLCGATSSVSRYGFATAGFSLSAGLGTTSTSWVILGDGRPYTNSTLGTNYADYASGNTVNIAIDIDAGKIWYGRNGTWHAGDPAAGTGAMHTFTAGTTIYLAQGCGASFSSLSATLKLLADYAYSPPSGFTAGWGGTAGINIDETPTKGALAISGKAASFSTAPLVAPVAGSVIITGQPATITAGVGLTLTPAAGSVAISVPPGPTRTNLFTWSAAFDNADWSKSEVTISPDAAAAPDGSGTIADAVIESTTTGAIHYVARSLTTEAATPYAISVYAKANGRNHLQIALSAVGFGADIRVLYDLSAGSASLTLGTPDSYDIEDAGGGWYRCSVVRTTTAAASAAVYLRTHNGSTIIYTGDGTSGLYLYGAQCEIGSTVSAYIPTEGVPVTRTPGVVTFSSAPLLSPASGAVQITGQPAVIETGSPLIVTPTVGSVLIDGKPVTVQATTGVFAQPAAGSVVIEGKPVTLIEGQGITLEPASGTITFTGQPAVVMTGIPAIAEPAAGRVEIAGKPVTVRADAVLQPVNGTLQVQGLPAHVTAVANAFLSTASGQVAIAGQAATLVTTANIVLSPSSCRVTFHGKQAWIETSDLGGTLVVAPPPADHGGQTWREMVLKADPDWPVHYKRSESVYEFGKRKFDETRPYG